MAELLAELCIIRAMRVGNTEDVSCLLHILLLCNVHLCPTQRCGLEMYSNFYII